MKPAPGTKPMNIEDLPGSGAEIHWLEWGGADAIQEACGQGSGLRQLLGRESDDQPTVPADVLLSA